MGATEMSIFRPLRGVTDHHVPLADQRIPLKVLALEERIGEVVLQHGGAPDRVGRGFHSGRDDRATAIESDLLAPDKGVSRESGATVGAHRWPLNVTNDTSGVILLEAETARRESEGAEPDDSSLGGFGYPRDAARRRRRRRRHERGRGRWGQRGRGNGHRRRRRIRTRRHRRRRRIGTRRHANQDSGQKPLIAKRPAVRQCSMQETHEAPVAGGTYDLDRPAKACVLLAILVWPHVSGDYPKRSRVRRLWCHDGCRRRARYRIRRETVDGLAVTYRPVRHAIGDVQDRRIILGRVERSRAPLDTRAHTCEAREAALLEDTLVAVGLNGTRASDERPAAMLAENVWTGVHGVHALGQDLGLRSRTLKKNPGVAKRGAKVTNVRAWQARGESRASPQAANLARKDIVNFDSTGQRLGPKNGSVGIVEAVAREGTGHTRQPANGTLHLLVVVLVGTPNVETRRLTQEVGSRLAAHHLSSTIGRELMKLEAKLLAMRDQSLSNVLQLIARPSRADKVAAVSAIRSNVSVAVLAKERLRKRAKGVEGPRPLVSRFGRTRRASERGAVGEEARVTNLSQRLRELAHRICHLAPPRKNPGASVSAGVIRLVVALQVLRSAAAAGDSAGRCDDAGGRLSRGRQRGAIAARKPQASNGSTVGNRKVVSLVQVLELHLVHTIAHLHRHLRVRKHDLSAKVEKRNSTRVKGHSRLGEERLVKRRHVPGLWTVVDVVVTKVVSPYRLSAAITLWWLHCAFGGSDLNVRWRRLQRGDTVHDRIGPRRNVAIEGRACIVQADMALRPAHDRVELTLGVRERGWEPDLGLGRRTRRADDRRILDLEHKQIINPVPTVGHWGARNARRGDALRRGGDLVDEHEAEGKGAEAQSCLEKNGRHHDDSAKHAAEATLRGHGHHQRAEDEATVGVRESRPKVLEAVLNERKQPQGLREARAWVTERGSGGSLAAGEAKLQSEESKRTQA
eukprot:scaffold76630_cov72-Phaeocystis_antarctica.AAC.2